jgi:hypothetical protein
LGKTLQSVLTQSERNTSLLRVLDRCVARSPGDRPHANELELLLREAARDLEVDAKKEHVWNKLLAISKVDRDQHANFAVVFDNSRPKFEALALGCGNAEFDRCRQVASFLSNVLEGCGLKELVRGRAKGKGPNVPTALDTTEVAFLKFLRNFDSHYFPRKTEALARFGSPDDAKIREMTLIGADQIATTIGITSLRLIVEAVL